MGAILDDAYRARFGTTKPKYMTDYNGTTAVPGSPEYDPNLDAGAKGVMYYPLVSYEQLTDTADISPDLTDKVKDAYELGLIRSEKGIARGQMLNGTELEPKNIVVRAKAAKALYFMWVLVQEVNVENDLFTGHIDNVAPTATVEYSTTAPANQDVVATITPSEAVTITNNGGSSSYTFTENGSFTFDFVDAAGNTGSATATVSNIDKVAPVLTLIPSTQTLWPANHKLVTVTISLNGEDEGSGVNTILLTSITSNEADNGLGDGNTTEDIAGADIGTFDTEFQLRAERSGKGQGRIYLITYTITDFAGNKSTATVEITVPHNK
jgi:hypothetical protein